MLSRFVTCAVTKPILLPRALAARKVCSRCRYVNKRKLIEEENPLSSFANIANFYQSTNFFLQSVFTRLSSIFDFTSRIIQTDNEPNRVGEDHSTAHDRIVVQKKAWQKGTLCGVQRINATARLDRCKFDERKTKCHKCNVHCYRPDMREKIREVMRFSGPRMIFHHPMEALRYILTK